MNIYEVPAQINTITLQSDVKRQTIELLLLHFFTIILSYFEKNNTCSDDPSIKAYTFIVL